MGVGGVEYFQGGNSAGLYDERREREVQSFCGGHDLV